MKLLITIVLVFLFEYEGASGSNILYMSAMASPSHHIWNSILAKGLLQNGHNITMVSPDKDKDSLPSNYSSILLEGIYTEVDEFNLETLADAKFIEIHRIFLDWCQITCSSIYESKGLQKLLNYPDDFKFDLIITDLTVAGCLHPVIARFGYPPTVGVTAFLLPGFLSAKFGNHLHPSYLPWYSYAVTTNMSLMQRVNNFLLTVMDAMTPMGIGYSAMYETLAYKRFGEKIPFDKIDRHISILLSNIDPVLDIPQPLTPNIIPVGGLHTKPSRAIPQDLLDILNNAKNGVILFSLGTNVRSDKLDLTKRNIIIEAFSKLSQTVLWKFESDIQNLPKNVIVRKWLPQNDILGHPNVKLFIGHGGALSTQEAIYHGVPFIGVPFFADQRITVRLMVKKKVALKMEFKHLTVDYINDKIKEILENNVYRDNVRKLSAAFRDQPQKPLERAVFWVEYVLRHKGALFLDSPARDLPFYISSSADVIAFLTATVFSIIAFVVIVIRYLCTCTSKKNKLKID